MYVDSLEVPTKVMSPKLGQVQSQPNFLSEVHQSTTIPLGGVAYVFVMYFVFNFPKIATLCSRNGNVI
jgi:hypothetical protein